MNGVRYTAYGLCLQSDSPLPGLARAATSQPPDIVISFERGGSFPHSIGEVLTYTSDWVDETSGEPGLVIHRSPADGSWILRYCDGIQFRIDADACRIAARVAPPSTIADMTCVLTGPVLGVALRLRGVVALHASAIEVGEACVLLVGDACAGKSTTAAMFARMGCRILTEDVAALSVDRRQVAVSAGCTEVALRPEAVARLFGSCDALPRFSDNWDKRRLDLEAIGAFSRRTLPVRAVYMLTNHASMPDAPCLAPMSSRDAMVELLANIYGNRLFHSELRLRELDTVHRLVSTVPVKAAVTGGRGTPVERFCEVVLDDVRAS